MTASEHPPRAAAPQPTADERRSPARFDEIAREWDASYDRPSIQSHWQRTRVDAAARLVGHGPGTLLEIGVGSGRLLAVLAERGWTVAGIDPAPAMVELARARLPGAAATRVTVDRAEALPFPDASFDAAVAIGVIEYTDMPASLAELARVLRRGGRAVIGLRNGRAPTNAWRNGVVHPLARGVKRIVPFGAPLPRRRRAPLSLARAGDVLGSAGLVIEHAELVGCAVLPDPLDRLARGLAYRAALRAERSRRLRRILGTQRLVVARRR